MTTKKKMTAKLKRAKNWKKVKLPTKTKSVPKKQSRNPCVDFIHDANVHGV